MRVFGACLCNARLMFALRAFFLLRVCGMRRQSKKQSCRRRDCDDDWAAEIAHCILPDMQECDTTRLSAPADLTFAGAG
jgi:hypothetical protein